MHSNYYFVSSCVRSLFALYNKHTDVGIQIQPMAMVNVFHKLGKSLVSLGLRKFQKSCVTLRIVICDNIVQVTLSVVIFVVIRIVVPCLGKKNLVAKE